MDDRLYGILLHQKRGEILKCKFDNLLEITNTALIFQSMCLVASVKPSRKFEKH